MEVVPRFLLRPCCEDLTHCTNTRQLDSAGVAAGKRILHDLADLNVRMAEYLSGSNVRYISTGDLLAGADNCSMGELMDSLYSCWSSDPVHGDKIAYHRIAMGLMDILSRKVSEGDLRNNINPKKRGRDDSPPPQELRRLRLRILLRQLLRQHQPPLRQPDGPQEQLQEGLLAVWSLRIPHRIHFRSSWQPASQQG
jgi:hypothetical protein